MPRGPTIASLVLVGARAIVAHQGRVLMFNDFIIVTTLTDTAIGKIEPDPEFDLTERRLRCFV